jgi:hypothetical protein
VKNIFVYIKKSVVDNCHVSNEFTEGERQEICSLVKKGGKKKKSLTRILTSKVFFFSLYYRRLMEEDDGALSEIEPDSVPNEVRDWLAMTFTRSMSTIKRRPSDKPKFKSVAQAIRAGIMVDRYVRSLCISFSFVYEKYQESFIFIRICGRKNDFFFLLCVAAVPGMT